MGLKLRVFNSIQLKGIHIYIYMDGHVIDSQTQNSGFLNWTHSMIAVRLLSINFGGCCARKLTKQQISTVNLIICYAMPSKQAEKA